MAGQGSLRQGTSRFRCDLQATRWRCASLIWLQALVVCGLTSALSAADTPPVDVRVVFEFDAPTAKPWSFQLRLSDPSGRGASISEIRNLSESATTSGIFELDRDGETLTVRSRHAITGGRIQIRLRGSRDTKLRVESQPAAVGDQNAFSERDVTIVDLLETTTIGSDNAFAEARSTPAWTITRSKSDWLRMEGFQPVPVYEPGSTLTASLRVNGMIDHASQLLVMHYSLYRVSHGEVVETHRWPIQIDAYGNSQLLRVSETLPEGPGVYEIRIQVEPDEEKIWSRLRRRPSPLVRATRPFAVLHGTDPAQQEPVAWDEAGVIRPSESSWSVGQWLPNPPTRLIPGASPITPAESELGTARHAGKSISLIAQKESFQATLPVQTPGYPHQVTIRLPSSSAARLLVQVGNSRDAASTSFILEAEPTGVQRSDWRDHTFVHYPVDGAQIWLTNLDTIREAAFESISVRAGPLYLATQTTLAEPSRSALLRLPGIDWPDAFTADVAKRTKLIDCDAATIELHKLWVASQRVNDYARALGFSGVVIPANSGARALYESSYFHHQIDVNVPRRHHLETLMELMSQSRLQVHVALKPEMLLIDLEKSIHGNQSQRGELIRSETTKDVDRDPNSSTQRRQAETRRATTQYNPSHPLVHRSVGSLVKELHDLCQGYEHFAGLIVDCDGRSHLHPPSETAIETGELLLFGRAHKMSVSVSQLRTWVQAVGREPFHKWKRDQLQQGYRIVSRATSSGGIYLLMPGMVLQANEDDRSEHGASSAKPVVQVDSTSPRMRSYRYGPTGVLAKQSMLRQQIMSAPSSQSAIFFGEHHVGNSSKVFRAHLLGDLSRIIERVDPKLLVIDMALTANNLNPDFAETLRSFSAIPSQNMRESLPIDSASRTVRLRWGTVDGYLYVSMIGVAPWTSDVDLEMTAPTTWELVGRSDPKAAESLVRSSGGTRTRVTVPAGNLIVVRARHAPGVSIRSWTTRVTGGPEVIESIKQKVTVIVERIGTLNEFKSYGRLTNGGFERTGEMGLIGWMHAQHPPGCVQIDNKEFVEGKNSVLLTTDTPATARTWIVSETMDPPQSGRLAVSLACRAEARAGDSTHRLRVSIEATRNGEPIRFTREHEIPGNGQWSARDVVLEADEINDTDIGSLRLTIDSLSGGRVWLDDVQLHDRFPTAKERADLQSQAFLAVQGLQRGNLAPSGRLLQNHWASYLLNLVPGEQSKRRIESVPAPAEEPSVAERIRSWLPVPLRF